MNRGDVYRVHQRLPERGNKPGFYVIVSRRYIVQHERVETVICAPVYSNVLGLATEVVIGPEAGLPRPSAIRCDYLSLLFKSWLTRRVGRVPADRMPELDRALGRALDLAPAF